MAVLFFNALAIVIVLLAAMALALFGPGWVKRVIGGIRALIRSGRLS